MRNGVNSVAHILFIQIAEEIAAHAVADSPSSDKTWNGTSTNLKSLRESIRVRAIEAAS